MRLMFDYQKNKKTTEVMSEIDGKPLEIIVAIGRLIQSVHNQTPEIFRPIFRATVQRLVSDDSPVWEEFGDGTIVIDMSGLMKWKE